MQTTIVYWGHLARDNGKEHENHYSTICYRRELDFRCGCPKTSQRSISSTDRLEDLPQGPSGARGKKISWISRGVGEPRQPALKGLGF